MARLHIGASAPRAMGVAQPPAPPLPVRTHGDSTAAPTPGHISLAGWTTVQRCTPSPHSALPSTMAPPSPACRRGVRGCGAPLAVAAVIAATLLATPACARIHHLTIKNDARPAFDIESFGFLPGGRMDLTLTSLSASPANVPHSMAFIVFGTSTQSVATNVVDELAISGICLSEDDPRFTRWNISLMEPGVAPLLPVNTSYTIHDGGLFSVVFMRCAPPASDNPSVSFHLDYTFVNPGPNYLSAGEMLLPAMYAFMAAAFGLGGLMWLVALRVNRSDVHKIHHLMTLLVVLKTVTLVFEAAMYQSIALTGRNTGWSIVYYIATFLRGCVMIVVIALIGAGWSVVKPFMSDREKKVLMVVLPLQILSNIAIIVVDEMDPGTIAVSAWTTVLHVTDVLAAVAVLLPIVWSVRQLKTTVEANRGDDKTSDTLARLQQFQSFYVITIAYLYITRIIVFLLSSTLSYNLQWFAPFVDEVVTLGYYAVVARRFRPLSEHSKYLRVPVEEEVVAAPRGEDADGVALSAVAAALGAGGGSGGAAGSGRVPVALDAGSNEVDAKASGASSRVVAPHQTVTRDARLASAPQTTAGTSKVAIADDDASSARRAEATATGGRQGGAVGFDDDDFGMDGVDDDDDDLDLEVGLRKPMGVTRAALPARSGGGGADGGGLKQVKKDRD